MSLLAEIMEYRFGKGTRSESLTSRIEVCSRSGFWSAHPCEVNLSMAHLTAPGYCSQDRHQRRNSSTVASTESLSRMPSRLHSVRPAYQHGTLPLSLSDSGYLPVKSRVLVSMPACMVLLSLCDRQMAVACSDCFLFCVDKECWSAKAEATGTPLNSCPTRQKLLRCTPWSRSPMTPAVLHTGHGAW